MHALEIFVLWEFEHIIRRRAPELLQMTDAFFIARRGIAIFEPLFPSGLFIFVVVGTTTPEMFGRTEGGLVDEVPDYIVNFRVKLRKRRDEFTLSFDCARIEISIGASPRFRY